MPKSNDFERKIKPYKKPGKQFIEPGFSGNNSFYDPNSFAYLT
jgi:hypothetical protein